VEERRVEKVKEAEAQAKQDKARAEDDERRAAEVSAEEALDALKRRHRADAAADRGADTGADATGAALDRLCDGGASTEADVAPCGDCPTGAASASAPLPSAEEDVEAAGATETEHSGSSDDKVPPPKQPTRSATTEKRKWAALVKRRRSQFLQARAEDAELRKRIRGSRPHFTDDAATSHDDAFRYDGRQNHHRHHERRRAAAYVGGTYRVAGSTGGGAGSASANNGEKSSQTHFERAVAMAAATPQYDSDGRRVSWTVGVSGLSQYGPARRRSELGETRRKMAEAYDHVFHARREQEGYSRGRRFGNIVGNWVNHNNKDYTLRPRVPR
jgi:hypothetical protein